MKLTVREMRPDELHIIPDYFHGLGAQDLERMGIDRAKIPSSEKLIAYCNQQLSKPYSHRENVCVVWMEGNEIIGFSTADTIDFGNSAKMHLHLLQPERRRLGLGTQCLRLSAEYYFDVLELARVFSEPNAYNVEASRALQKAGFKYLKTYETTPGYINFHQAVTRWVLDCR